MSATPESQSSSASEWHTCSPGTLGSMATVQKRKHAQQQFGKIAAATTLAVVLLASASYFFRGGEQGRVLGGLACNEVLNNLDGYILGKVDSDLSSRMEEHLAGCPKCQHHYEERRASLQASISSSASWLSNQIVTQARQHLSWSVVLAIAN